MNALISIITKADSLAIILLIIAGVLAIVILASAAVKKRRERITNAVKKQSQRYVSIQLLNQYYAFVRGTYPFSYQTDCSSMNEYNNFRLAYWIYECIHGGVSEKSRLLLDYEAADYKRKNYKHYLQDLARIPNSSTSPLKGVSDAAWIKAEKKLCDQLVIDNSIPTFSVRVCYTTPVDKKHYENVFRFRYEDIVNALETINQSELEKYKKAAFVSEERSKMTQSLRYDVFKRDNFRCQICGRSQRDGVILEVDHIVPVSRGGKTELDNLQTLCMDCNRGKRDKE